MVVMVTLWLVVGGLRNNVGGAGSGEAADTDEGADQEGTKSSLDDQVCLVRAWFHTKRTVDDST